MQVEQEKILTLWTGGSSPIGIYTYQELLITQEVAWFIFLRFTGRKFFEVTSKGVTSPRQP